MRRISFLSAAVLWSATLAHAQITVTAPAAGTTTVGPADDYATRAFQDPWDMNQYSDLGWFTLGADQPAANLSAISVSGGVFSANPTNADPNFWLLDSWVPGSALLGKVGKLLPIDAAKYRVLVLRMRLDLPAPPAQQAMQILWSNNTIYGSEPGGGIRVSNSVLTYDGWNIYAVDLGALGSAVGPGWSGSVDALRIDPTQYQVGQIQLDWARLVNLDNPNLQRTIQWTGAASVDIFLDSDQSSANGTLGQIARGASGGSFAFYVGGLEPGDYYVGMRAAGTANALDYSAGLYRVLAQPTLRVTAPSEEGSSDDFATSQLNDAWDMVSTADADRTTGLTGFATGTLAGVNEAGQSLGSVGVLQGTSTPATIGDPAVYWMWSTKRGQNYRIDADRYRVLTFELGLPGARNLAQGSIARVVWKVAEESAENVSQDIVVNHRAGVNVFAKVIADMKTLELESDPGGSPSTTGWVSGGGSKPGIDNFRIDPHEFSAATGFSFRRVKLAAFERAGSAYTIAWAFANPSGLSTTLDLVADLDRQGCDGITIATGLDPATQSFSWTLPVGFNDGEARYVCAQLRSGATVLNQSYSRWPIVREVGYTGPLPRLVPERQALRFGAVNNGGTLTALTPTQSVVVTQVGGGAASWTASSDQSWVQVTPGSTSGTAVLSLGIVNPGGILPATGSLRATVSIAGTGIENSPQYVDVYLDVRAPGTTVAPFGSFDTPANGATGVTGSTPVTGWALDDVGVSAVEIWRDPVPGLEPPGDPRGVFIGNALFVAGARPDVEAAYSATMPRAHVAGWGYMLLTNFLPDSVAIPNKATGGNGAFTLRAYAVDLDGHTTLLGAKTITCDNANATKPFGTIDTPAQGGSASGSAFVNFGWALTPQPASIPTTGATIWVYVDGVPLGHPTYNQFRSDIATLFPGYANTGGAVGYYPLDTTTLANGVHTIAWSVTDSLGRADGIGSRYFSVVNGSPDALPGGTVAFGDLGQSYGPDLGRDVAGLRSSSQAAPARALATPQSPALIQVPARSGGQRSAYVVAGGRLDRLPAGAGFDAATGLFHWQPGEGFTGDYRFLVVERRADSYDQSWPLDVRVAPGRQSGP